MYQHSAIINAKDLNVVHDALLCYLNLAMHIEQDIQAFTNDPEISNKIKAVLNKITKQLE